MPPTDDESKISHKPPRNLNILSDGGSTISIVTFTKANELSLEYQSLK